MIKKVIKTIAMNIHHQSGIGVKHIKMSVDMTDMIPNSIKPPRELSALIPHIFSFHAISLSSIYFPLISILWAIDSNFFHDSA